MSQPSGFERLLDEANKVPTIGWDFSWFEGRATEERPTWGYSRMLIARIEHSRAMLELQTGGGERLVEMLSQVKHRPGTIVATESWSPNAALAKVNLAPYDVTILEQDDEAVFPLPDNTFDLVCARHPTATPWDEIARVLQSGGAFISQQIGSGTNRELTEFMMGHQSPLESQNAQYAATLAGLAGLEVTALKEESLPVVFFDVGAVVYFLRKVVWTVPDFTVDKYRERLFAIHEYIQQHGSFQSHARRFLIEAIKPKRPRFFLQ
jgi:SAM-dependent methyltransferase